MAINPSELAKNSDSRNKHAKTALSNGRTLNFTPSHRQADTVQRVGTYGGAASAMMMN